MILQKPIVVGQTIIPAGSELIFDQTGLAEYDGIRVLLSQIPDGAVKQFEIETAVEAVNLKTKGQLAVDMLISCCITILQACPLEDRNSLRKVLSAARQASTASKPSQTFKRLLHLEDIQQ